MCNEGINRQFLYRVKIQGRDGGGRSFIFWIIPFRFVEDIVLFAEREEKLGNILNGQISKGEIWIEEQHM